MTTSEGGREGLHIRSWEATGLFVRCFVSIIMDYRFGHNRDTCISRKVPFCKGFLDVACMATVNVLFRLKNGFVATLRVPPDLVV